MRLITEFVIGVLLFEAMVCGAIYTFRYASDFADASHYYNLYQTERITAEFYQSKVECAKKQNGCSKQAVETAIRRAR